jgi:ABC-type spermidine/putrescine transport system permease subunit I
VSWLPSMLRLRVPRLPTLWLPLFLLWPLVLLLFVLLFVAGFALESRSQRRRSSVFECLAGVWQLLCATRGTTIDVEAATTRVCVSIY